MHKAVPIALFVLGCVFLIWDFIDRLTFRPGPTDAIAVFVMAGLAHWLWGPKADQSRNPK